MSQTPPTPESVDEDDPYADEADEGQTARMSFLDHLDELRRRLVVSVVSILVGFLVAFFFIERIFAFVMRPLQAVLPNDGKLVYTEPAEAFLLYMKIAFLVGLFLALPVVLFQLWMFVAPGLYAHEKKFAIPFVFFATLFFVAGAAFSHYLVFPWAWGFFASFTTDYMAFMPKIDAVFSLYVRMLLAMGVVFQLPTAGLLPRPDRPGHAAVPAPQLQVRRS